MGKSAIRVVALTLVTAACTGGSSSSPLVPDSGRLVILDESGDIVIIDPDGSGEVALTEDAGDGVAYTQPIWSPDATSLAWGQLNATGFAVGIVEVEAGETSIVYTPNLPFYMFWSPTGEILGVLHNGVSGVDFQMVDVSAGTSERIDGDSSFYFSWSPSGDRVVTHAGASRVETIKLDGDRLRLAPTDADYLAPQWTEAGIFHVAEGELALENDGERVPLISVPGVTFFVSNPQGTHVALQSVGGDGDLTASLFDVPISPSDQVLVLDVETGDIEVVSEEPALGFFWSPDGGSLLVLTLSPQRDAVIPRVSAIGNGSTEYPGYVPPGTMIQDTFPFFPQYAQSVSFWSPDSSAFTYAGDIDGERGIWVQELDQTSPSFVSEGNWVVWSPASD